MNQTRRLLLAGVGVLTLAADVAAQSWSVDVSAGRTAYHLLPTEVGTDHVAGTLRYDTARGAWVYGTAAAPLRAGDSSWGAFGAGGRMTPSPSVRRLVTPGVDLNGTAFLYRDAVVEQTGRGGTIDAIPFVSVKAGAGAIEGRGGWRGYTLAAGGAVEHRGVFETGVRGTYGDLVRLQGDMKWVHASEGTFPFASVTLVYSSPRAQAWALTGKWMSDQVDSTAWAAGFGVALGTAVTLWADVRQETPDPLYWNSTRRIWGVGLTRRFGGHAVPLQSVARSETGRVVIAVPASDAKGNAVFLAGDFNNWQPMPMQREGQMWVARLPLAPGVYRYAFRTADGEWFVPESVPGRRDDGMGGYVAVLVVS